MDSKTSNISEVRETKDRGKGLFAIADIDEGDLIFDWEPEGLIFEANKASDLPEEVRDYAIQFAVNKWVDTKGIGRFANHSCNPNSVIIDSFKLVAIRKIKEGEEILWDYDTTENSDWIMPGKCMCREPNCRGIIRGYRYLTDEIREKYRNHISQYLK